VSLPPAGSVEWLAPAGARSRVAANLQALRILAELEREERSATVAERELLALWSSWGAVPTIFDEDREEWAAEREELRVLLRDERHWAQARRTTINAHYTHPEIATAMWALARELGFTGGRVLEPGCGAGVFIGLAPPGAQMVGVELDDTTAAIAQQLHPDARVIARSLADYRPRDGGAFDLVIGNVPFADVRLHDPAYNRRGHSIHNHFIVKSLALTRPGGLVMVLSSRYTLDSGNPAARREMAELGDLLGAIRLPTGAHRRAAGTDALTDLLVFRRRADGAQPLSETWVNTQTVAVGGGEARINAHFIEHPNRMLGQLDLAHGMYSAETLKVSGDLDATAIAQEIAVLGQQIALAAPAITLDDAPAPSSTRHVAAVAAPEGLWDGHLLTRPDGSFAEVKDGLQEPVSVPRTAGGELRLLLDLRDSARALLTAEAHTLEDTPSLEQLRARLRESYNTYYVRYGAINRFALQRTGRTDPETGEEIMRRVAPRAITALRGDPFAPLVMSLEVFDDATQTATAAALLSKRMIAPRAPVLGADSPQDALAVCLDTVGRVDLDEIARLLGRTAQDARADLGELVYNDPTDSPRLVAAAEYLSGNVRVKLEHARAAAANDTSFEVNVTALERVLPADIGADEIAPRLGAAWITTEDHQAFLAEILDDRSVQVEHPGANVWAVRARRDTLLASSEWGTSRMSAGEITKAMLEQRPITVADELDDGRRVVNAVETAAAQDKANALQERFAEWCWEDPDRAGRLLGEYNRRFNSIVLRDYSSEGERLSLPGLARSFQPRAHQRAAVARIIAEPAVGLFHQVGAGKTAEMIIGVTELRRLGMVRKPCLVVPNHMLEQFNREYLQLYPQSRVLAASSSDLAGEKRRQFVARAASHDWNAIILTRSAFERIPVNPETEARYMESELADTRKMLANAQAAGGRLTVKRIEKLVLTREQQLAQKLDVEKDPGISFEATGVDYLAIDEAHSYKNLQTVSNIPGAAIEGSKRATDLHLKTMYLRERYGGHVATLATATPIANSITEAHVMQRYLRPDLLADAGVEHFDQWAATFGQTVTAIEMAPTGGGSYRVATRFARYQNVPEMLRMFHVFADVKTAQDLDLPIPQIAVRGDGQRAAETVVIPASPEIISYVAELGQRAEQVRARAVLPEDDNMLKITGDGRKAALDMRLATGQPAAGACKLDVAAGRIAGIWREHRDQPYNDPDTGERSPVPGALQIVFCDLGTPREGWNAYDELREQLTALGVPSHQVHYIHEARNDAEKGRLFAAARAGHISVLIGSTEKMGVGTNIQARAVALHLLDCPWRPSDQEQREGRILRQGNQNQEVQICRYVVEGSFDAYSWQTVERKARFINQVMRGRLDAREIEDIGDNTLSFAEVKALASGDPLILDKAHADAELTGLSRLERAWQRSRHTLRGTLALAEQRIDARERQIDEVSELLAHRSDTHGDLFQITINGSASRERKAAGEQLAQWAARAEPGPSETQVAQLAGLAVTAKVGVDAEHGGRALTLRVQGHPDHVTVRLDELAANPAGTIQRLENRARGLDSHLQQLTASLQDARQEAERARSSLAQPFKHASALEHARTRVAQITEQMQAASHSDTSEATHGGDSPQAAEPTNPPDIAPPRLASDATRQRPPVLDVDAAASIALADRAHPQAPGPAASSPPPIDAEPSLDPQTAESLRLLRATQAAPVTDALRSPTPPSPPARTTPRGPSRSPRPRR
jgi:N12 class adenine-specific DNA methylase